MKSEWASIVEMLRRLVAYPTVNPPGGKEREAQLWVAELLRGWGLEVDVFEVFPERPDVVGILRGTGGGRSVILNGHIDVAPPEDPADWTADPFTLRIDGDRLVGRGVTDMKGGLAGFLAALQQVRERAGSLRGDVIFECVIGEERGEPGTLRCVERGYRADFAIVGEASEARAVLAGMGTLTGQVTVESDIALHFGARRLCIQTGGGVRGASCVEKMATRIIPSLLDLERDWAVFKTHPLITPGMALINVFQIEGGGNPGFMPGRCAIDVAITYYPNDTEDGLKREVEEALARASAADPWLRDHPARVDWSGYEHFRFLPYEFDPDHPGVRLLGQVLREVAGRELRIGGRGTMCDGGVLHRAGIPVVVFGPGKIHQSHRIDEYVMREDLEVFAAAIREFILRWCG